MLCVSILQPAFDGIKAAVSGLDFVEIRLDGVAKLTVEGVTDLFQYLKSNHIKTIATLRPGKISEPLRQKMLLAAIEAGSDYVDLEIESEMSWKRPLIASGKKAHSQIIISYHNYDVTPELSELNEIIRASLRQGADLVKIATMVNTPRESSRLLGLLEQRPMVVIGMGEMGQITRVAAPLMGAPFTFAAQDHGEIAAPGQFTGTELKEIWRRIANG